MASSPQPKKNTCNVCEKREASTVVRHDIEHP